MSYPAFLSIVLLFASACAHSHPVAHAPSPMSMLAIGDPGPAPPRATQRIDPPVRDWLSVSMQRCDAALFTVATAEKRAFDMGDLVLLNSLRDKNVTLRALRRMLIERVATLRGTDDRAEQNHEFAVIEVLNQRIGTLLDEARNAVCEHPTDEF